MLAAVQEIHISLPHGRGFAVQPRAAVGLREPKADHQIARGHFRQIGVALFRPAGLHQVHTAVVHVQLGANAPMHLGDLFEHRCIFDCTQPQAAECFRHEAIKQVVLAKLGPQVLKRDVFVLFNLWHHRVDFSPQELFHIIEIGQVVTLARKLHDRLRPSSSL